MKKWLSFLLIACLSHGQLVGPNAPAFMCCEFDPLEVNGLILWLDVNRMGIANNTAITPFTDYSYLRQDMTQGTDTKRATNFVGQINGRAAAHFDGLDDAYVGGAIYTTNQAFTIQLVLKFDSATGTESVFCHGSGATTGYRVLKNVNLRNGTSRAVAAMDDQACTTSWEIWSFRRTSAPLATLIVNSTNAPLANNTGGMNNPSGSPILGQFESIGLFFAGYLAELRVWDNDIGLTNEFRSINDLRKKYNLP